MWTLLQTQGQAPPTRSPRAPRCISHEQDGFSSGLSAHLEVDSKVSVGGMKISPGASITLVPWPWKDCEAGHRSVKKYKLTGPWVARQVRRMEREGSASRAPSCAPDSLGMRWMDGLCSVSHTAGKTAGPAVSPPVFELPFIYISQTTLD